MHYIDTSDRETVRKNSVLVLINAKLRSLFMKRDAVIARTFVYFIYLAGIDCILSVSSLYRDFIACI